MPPTAAGIRARNRAALEHEILAIGRRHLAERGAAALSLRAIARELGMAPSAVYRYVASRDELLTLLIVEAYDSLGDAVDTALAGVGEPMERFRAVGRALRGWAAAHPHQFALVYGSPVPGYAAPADRTNPSGTRVTDRLLEILVEVEGEDGGHREQAARGEPRTNATASAAVGVGQAVGGLSSDPLLAVTSLTAEGLTRGLAAWTLVLGTVTAEQFEQFGPEAIADPAAYFEQILDLAVGLARP